MIQDPVDNSLLCEKALKGTLTNEEVQKLTRILQLEPKLTLEWKITPEQFAILVKLYPDIAVSLLIASNDKPKQVEYYKALFGLPLTNEVAGVIVKTQNALEVPIIYYEAFVSTSMDNCMKEDQNEKYGNGNKSIGQARTVLRIVLNYMAKVPEFLSLIQQDTLDKVCIALLINS